MTSYAFAGPDCPAEHVLGVVEHTVDLDPTDCDRAWPSVRVHTASSADQAFKEVWTSSNTVHAGRSGDISYGHDGETLFCAVQIPEAPRYRPLVEKTYGNLWALLDELNFTPFRLWNYIGGINTPNADGLERYRDFCEGRAEALEDTTRNWTADLPAASGVGSRSGGITVCCLAARSLRTRNFENPRQVPAYRYPPQYGRRSPSFARASLVTGTGGTASLYVSGTAAVVGHATMHGGDVKAQCRTTLDNLRALVSHVGASINATVDLSNFRLIKAYVRHTEHIPIVEEELRTALGPSAVLQFLNVDICRSDLLMEVEGLAYVNW